MAVSDPASARGAHLGRGSSVRVRSQEEILATLSPDGTVDGLPFMPEMLAWCGQELQVSAAAHKTCNTIQETGPTLRMINTVHLAGARCDGSAHGGCQAGCLLYWREEWLERADEPGRPVAAPPRPAGPALTAPALSEQTQSTDPSGNTTFRCQATELLNATSPLKRTDVDQYLADVRSRNVTVWVLLKGLLIDAFNRYQNITGRRFPRWLRLFGARSYPFLRVTGTGAAVPTAGLHVGDLVEVRSKAEILATLGPNYKNRGMLYDGEMLPYSGRRARVERSVERIVDEKTGRMIKLSDCYVLADTVCTGIYHRFCPRAITPYWREAWLRRIPDDGDPDS